MGISDRHSEHSLVSGSASLSTGIRRDIGITTNTARTDLCETPEERQAITNLIDGENLKEGAGEGSSTPALLPTISSMRARFGWWTLAQCFTNIRGRRLREPSDKSATVY